MASQLNYNPNENIGSVQTAINVFWSASGIFDYENIGNLRFAFDADRLIPPREGQLYPQGPFFGTAT